MLFCSGSNILATYSYINENAWKFSPSMIKHKLIHDHWRQLSLKMNKDKCSMVNNFLWKLTYIVLVSLFKKKKCSGLRLWPAFILLLQSPCALTHLISVALFYITVAFSCWAKPNRSLFDNCITSQMLPLENWFLY